MKFIQQSLYISTWPFLFLPTAMLQWYALAPTKMYNCPLKLGVHYKCSLQNSPHSSTSIVDHAASFQVLHTRYPQKQKQAKKEQIWLILCMCIGMLFTTVLDCSQLPCGSWDLLEECRPKQVASQACLFIASAQNSFFDHLDVPLCSPAPLAEKRTCPHNYCEDGVKHCHRVLDNGPPQSTG